MNLVNMVINGSGNAESDHNVTSKVYTHLHSLFDHQAWSEKINRSDFRINNYLTTNQ